MAPAIYNCANLLVHANRSFNEPINPRMVACCPTMDLIAVVSQAEHLLIYRFNGQRVFKFPGRGDKWKISCIEWKFNGQCLALGWSDGAIDTISAETGKVLQHTQHITTPSFMTHEREVLVMPSSMMLSGINHINWSLKFTKYSSIKCRVSKRLKSLFRTLKQDERKYGDLSEDVMNLLNKFDVTDDVKLEDYMQREPDWDFLKSGLDLPEKIAMLSPENVLPKLPVIPLVPISNANKSVINPEIFSQQTSLDLLLQSGHRDNPISVEVMTIFNEKGSASIILYDSLNLGNFDIVESAAMKEFKVLDQFGHPFACTSMLLIELKGDDTSDEVFFVNKHFQKYHQVPQNALAIIPMSLGFIRRAGLNLHVIASKTAQLTNILHYVERCILTISYYWDHAHELPNKFMRNVNEALAALGSESGTLVQNLYVLAIMGHFEKEVKEWLVDQVGERGMKRWDQCIKSSYDKLIELTHENLIPAIDRLTILISTIKGLAKHYAGTGIMNVSTLDINSILARLRCMRLLAFRSLEYARKEKTCFSAFSKWMKHQIYILALDSSSQNIEETGENDPHIDYSRVLDYIRGPLTLSKLSHFYRPFDPRLTNLTSHNCGYDQVVRLCGQLDQLTYNHETSQPHYNGISSASAMATEPSSDSAASTPDFLTLSFSVHFTHLAENCVKISEKITESQAENVCVNFGIILDTENQIVRHDIRMIFMEDESYSPELTRNREPLDYFLTNVTYISAQNQSCLNLLRFFHDNSVELHRNVYQIQSLLITIPDSIILDVKFVDDSDLILLVKNYSRFHLLWFNYSGIKPRGRGNIKSSHADSLNIYFTDTYISQFLLSNPEFSSRIKLPVPSDLGSDSRPKGSLIINLNDSSTYQRFVRHTFPNAENNSSFKPSNIYVNGQTNRRWICILGHDNLHYQILDLDFTNDYDKSIDLDALQLKHLDAADSSDSPALPVDSSTSKLIKESQSLPSNSTKLHLLPKSLQSHNQNLSDITHDQYHEDDDDDANDQEDENEDQDDDNDDF